MKTMKFTIINTISYDINEKVVYDFLERENMTIEDYKNELSNNLKELFETNIGTSEDLKNLIIKTDIQIENNTDSYCPICAENIGNEPFCSSCGDVSGAEAGEYSLHERDYYIDKQIKLFGKVLIKPVNYLKEKN